MEKLKFNYPGKSAVSYDPIALAKAKADTFNQIPGNLTGYDCPKCLNRGSIALVQNDKLAFGDCDCMRIRRCVTKMEASGLRNIISEKTFDAFQTEESWQAAIKRGTMEYADNPQGWLLLCGQSGCGKTHLAVAVCRQRLLSGDTVQFMPWRDDIAALKSMSLDSENRQKKLDELKSVPLLYIDDLFKTGKAADGSSNPTGADINLAFEILNFRYNNHLATIISTEKTPEELVGIDEAVGGRIVEMAAGHTYHIQKNPKRNYRLRGVVDV